MATEQDFRLVARILSGDAVEQLVSNYRPLIYAILTRHLSLHPADADEVFARFLFHIWEDDFRRLRSWSGRAPLAAFLGQIARNLARDYCRERRAALAETAKLEAIIDERTADSDCKRAIDTALQNLPARDRELIHRRYFRDETNREIAMAMDMTTNAVGAALCRAQKRLKQILGDRVIKRSRGPSSV